MHLLGTTFKERAHIVAQLRTAHDRVVAEHHPVALHDGTVGYKLHLCHKVASRLVARSKTARPCRSIFQYGTLVWNLMSLGISQCESHSRVGNAAHEVSLSVVLLAKHLSASFPHVLSVDSLVVACRESVIYPQERAYLRASRRSLQHLHSVSLQLHDLSRFNVAHHLIVEIRESRCLARHRVCTWFFANHDRCAACIVARCNNTVLSHDKHRARTLDTLIHLVDTIHVVLTHIDEQGHQFRLVDFVSRQLTEVHTLRQQFVGNLAKIIDFCNAHHGISAQVRIYYNRLRVGVANHPESLISREAIQFVFKLRSEVVALETMNRSRKSLFLVKCYHSRTLCAEMRVVVCTVEQVVDAVQF